MRLFLNTHGNRISDVYWLADKWFPDVSPTFKIRWIEKVINNEFKFPKY